MEELLRRWRRLKQAPDRREKGLMLIASALTILAGAAAKCVGIL